MGQGISERELREIAPLPWSAVITSRPEEHLAALFQSPGRHVAHRYARVYAEEQIHTRVQLSRTSLPVLQLFGDPPGLLEGPEDAMTEDEERYCAWKMLELLPDLMDRVHPLVLVGVDSNADWFLMPRLSMLLWRCAAEGSVSIWGISSETWARHPKGHAALERCGVRCCPSSLHEILSTPAVQALHAAAPEDLPEECLHGDLYYQDGRAVFLPPHEQFFFQNIVSLLTERVLHWVRPREEDLQSWFSSFLRDSRIAPAWYGYHRRSPFHVQRSFEEPLFQLVCQALHGQPEKNRLIVLSGPPCSSKSITLAAIAYRAFCLRCCPILYLSQDLLDSLDYEPRYLDTALQDLAFHAAAKTPTLLILDSSLPGFLMKRVYRLYDALNQRGRRFVMVCSSRDAGIAGTEICRAAEERTIVFAQDTFNEQEQSQFWEICRHDSGLSDAVLTKLQDRLRRDGTAEVAIFYHKLKALLRRDDLYGSEDAYIAYA